LAEIYYESIGRGTALLLNLPPDCTGRIHSTDVEALRGFRNILDGTFAHDFARHAKITASNVRGNDKQFSPGNVIDGNLNTYWSTDDGVTNADLVLDLGRPVTFNVVRLGEYLPLGQRVDAWGIDQWQDGQWVEFAKGEAIGNCRLVRGEPITTSKVRVRFCGPVGPAISEVGLFAEPESMEAPAIHRDKDGLVTLASRRPVFQIHYTTDASKPSTTSPLYSQPFVFEGQGIIRAATFGTGGRRGDIGSREFDLGKKLWRISGCSAEVRPGQAALAIDDDDTTCWETAKPDKGQAPLPQWIAVDMGRTENLVAFTYQPRTDQLTGVVDHYQYEASQDGQTWTKVAEGEFANIRNSPVLQTVTLSKPVACRYFKFVATHVLEGNIVTAAELGVRCQ